MTLETRRAEITERLVRAFVRGWRRKRGAWGPFGQDEDYDGDDEAGEQGDSHDDAEE